MSGKNEKRVVKKIDKYDVKIHTKLLLSFLSFFFLLSLSLTVIPVLLSF